MAGANGSLLQTHLPNPSLSHLFAALDPKSLILSQFQTNEEKPNLFQLTTDSFVMERGPRYYAYARLRESKLRLRSSQYREPEVESSSYTPLSKKQGSYRGCSVLAQSVPDFATVVRKENRKPPAVLPPVRESPAKTPVGPKGPRLSGIGAKSVNSGEKRSLRKSYANMEELKGVSMSGGERERGRRSKTVLGYKKY